MEINRIGFGNQFRNELLFEINRIESIVVRCMMRIAKAYEQEYKELSKEELEELENAVELELLLEKTLVDYVVGHRHNPKVSIEKVISWLSGFVDHIKDNPGCIEDCIIADAIKTLETIKQPVVEEEVRFRAARALEIIDENSDDEKDVNSELLN